MKAYEVMYIVKVMADNALQAIVTHVNAVINGHGGNVKKADLWGKKRLAYEIEDNTEGVYVLVTFEGSPACVRELDRVMRINEDILRHMIISKGE